MGVQLDVDPGRGEPRLLDDTGDAGATVALNQLGAVQVPAKAATVGGRVRHRQSLHGPCPETPL